MRIFIIIILLSACTPNPLPAWKRHILDRPPNTENQQIPKLYLEGWQDGCRTGVGMYSTFLYQNYWGWRQDAIKAQNQVYYKGWKDAFDYCGRYMWSYNKKDFL